MDQSLLAAPHGLSQPATSFVASQCQGIHTMLFSFLIDKAAPEIKNQSPDLLFSSPALSLFDCQSIFLKGINSF
jgi:hypothetical protein